uniref:Vacuolar protein sorting-associated protein 53 homolog n=1 Tax=Daphnia lumholtzi TaxID=42856 RepID=A0A4Y7MA33_9CRUS|nr:EOG090X024P [Daphnia lumholtzi]SVE78094.1 EOG090X024P [Daphnia lumholtzi]
MAAQDVDDFLDDELVNQYIIFPPEVTAAIDLVFPSQDPLDRADFNPIDYINNLFPTEQSLSNIEEVISDFQGKIHSLDSDIKSCIRSQSGVSADGAAALEEAQVAVSQLFARIKDIRAKAEKSEHTVREITRDIKQLDIAKRNLTSAITTLNHLHFLVFGVDQLQSLCQKRQYSEIASLLQGVNRVMEHFTPYLDIPQVKQLAAQLEQIEKSLGDQISNDFKEAFSGTGPKQPSTLTQLSEACSVLNVIEPRFKREIIRWFVSLQLVEYSHLFQESEENAWLDRIDRRYAWIKRHLLNFEERMGRIFSQDWEMSERIAVEFCHLTRNELTRIMAKRVNEIDVKLLLFTLQKTTQFEELLSRRFTGASMEDLISSETSSKKTESTNPFEESHGKNPFEEDEEPEKPVPSTQIQLTTTESLMVSPFHGLISRCFESHLNIFVDSQDKNLAELIDRFVADLKIQGSSLAQAEIEGCCVLPSCADLFVFYKKCLLQCAQLSTGQPMLSLTSVFKKYLREYATRLLQSNLPRSNNTSSITPVLPMSMSSLTKDFTRELRDLSSGGAAGLIQNFQSLLKEGDMSSTSPKYSKDDIARICTILTTAEYCLETTQQLEGKLKEKVQPALADKVDLGSEQDLFGSVISQCIQLLVADLEGACEPALVTMAKTAWQTWESVGDQSQYVTLMTSQFKLYIPFIRDCLTSSRKYFTQFCMRFVNAFMARFVQQLYKCKPVGVVGAEQLLLDTHMLKTALLDLPSVGSQVARKPPASYSKMVVKGMTRAEMILKVVMDASDTNAKYVAHYIRLLPESEPSEFQKILDMKGVRRSEQQILVEIYRSQQTSQGNKEDSSSFTSVATGDNLEQYGWKEHDGRNFGVQVVIDKFIQLETSFVTKLGGKHGGDWTARIQVEPREWKPMNQSNFLDFLLFMGTLKSSGIFDTTVASPHLVKEALQSGLRLMEDKRSKERHISLAGTLFAKEDILKQPNFVVHQVTGKLPLQLEIVYESNSFIERGAMLRGEAYDTLLQKYREQFRIQFESKFRLNEKGFSEEEQEFAKSAMSNLVGGIGYFYGSSKVQSVHNKEPVPYWNAPLYTAVPSRSFFPRGFLWDEGFHNLIISQWDREISFDIMAHWFDLMNVEGWIPREQILGSEARARVPDEFVVQRNNQGNPPTFFLVLDAMFKNRPVRDISALELEQLNRMWPRLVSWYNWFNTSLHGPEPGTYYWRGRDTASVRELNPKSLSSGLDDYPRASHPTTYERHLDLRCWITLAAKVMASIADLTGREGRKYHETFIFLSNNELLNAQHWSEKAKRYADYGLHTSNVTLRRPKSVAGQPKPDKIRWVSEEPTPRFVDDTFGYVSLFPLIIEILQPDSPQLGQLLQDLRNPNLLWTKYGLRSLSKTSPLYNKRNTEHDPPYWRGPIWINVNYLVARALHHYSAVEGPHQTRALLLYNELRENLISNVLREYRKTGYIWEQYNDANGAGQGCRPFTGWSTLVLLLMSETYV